jgi:tetratricopeptide (TPR) repeat protein
LFFTKLFRKETKISEKQYQLARQAFEERRFFEAVALFRTGLALSDKVDKAIYTQLAEAYYQLGLCQIAAQTLASAGAGGQDLQYITESADKGDEGLKNIPHHTYVRLKILAEHIRRLYSENLSTIRLLDIGGGAGYLACFLPDVQYVLVEPTVNKLSSFDLPFNFKTFDCVVSCHVLEHVEESARFAFLDKLCSLAKSSVILLNPFQMADERLDKIADKDLQMVWEITGVPWAREHLECGEPPSLDMVRDYANTHNYSLQITPNNCHFSQLLYVYMEYFAHAACRYEDFQKINRVFNELDYKLMANDLFPNDYTCVLNVS